MNFILSEQSQDDLITKFKNHTESKQHKKFNVNLDFQSIKKIKHLTHVLTLLNFGMNKDTCGIISEYWICNTIVLCFDGGHTLCLHKSKNELQEYINKYNYEEFCSISYSYDNILIIE